MIRQATDVPMACAREAHVLAALNDPLGRTSAELVDETGLLAEVVRSTLRELQRRVLVWRSITGPWAGRWRLTALGRVEVSRRQREGAER